MVNEFDHLCVLPDLLARIRCGVGEGERGVRPWAISVRAVPERFKLLPQGSPDLDDPVRLGS